MFLLSYSFSVFKCNNTWIAALSLSIANMQIMHKLCTPDGRANVFFPNCDIKTHRRSLSTHISFVCFVCIYKKRTIVTNALLYIYVDLMSQTWNRYNKNTCRSIFCYTQAFVRKHHQALGKELLLYFAFDSVSSCLSWL